MGVYSARIYEVNVIVHIRGIPNPEGVKRFIGSFCISEDIRVVYEAQNHPVLEHTIEHAYTKVTIE
jgi:hypothetical protein